MDQLRVTKFCTKEREQVRLELPVGRGAVEAEGIRADLGYRLRQSGRAGDQEAEMP